MTRVSLTAPQFSADPQPLFGWAATAEAAGFDGLFVFDHLVPLGNPHRPVLELAGTLGAVAAATSRTTVGSLVMRVPLRGAEISAAVAATVDAIAPGRTLIGLGTGDSLSQEEDERFGRPRARLDRRLESTRRAALAIRETTPSVRLWVGGVHPRVRALAADVAHGWNGWGVEAEQFEELARTLPAHVERTWGGAIIVGVDRDDVARAVQRRGSPDRAIVGTVDEVATALRRFVAAGASHLVLSVLPNRPDRWEVASGLLARIG